MAESSVIRTVVSSFAIDDEASFASVEVRRITMAPNVHPGAHWHNGPVFGVVESGSVFFQVQDQSQRVLRPGDTFFEPGDTTITRFDAITIPANSYILRLGEHFGDPVVQWVSEEDGQRVVLDKEPGGSFWREFLVGAVSILPIDNQL